MPSTIIDANLCEKFITARKWILENNPYLPDGNRTQIAIENAMRFKGNSNDELLEILLNIFEAMHEDYQEEETLRQMDDAFPDYF
jgi:hypothetical protein